MSIEEVLIFWRKSFSNISDDKFNKDYRYGFRFGYGLEGSMRNYAPKKYVSHRSIWHAVFTKRASTFIAV